MGRCLIGANWEPIPSTSSHWHLCAYLYKVPAFGRFPIPRFGPKNPVVMSTQGIFHAPHGRKLSMVAHMDRLFWSSESPNLSSRSPMFTRAYFAAQNGKSGHGQRFGPASGELDWRVGRYRRL